LKKKQKERAYLDILKGNIQDFPSGNIIESEHPDFIVGTPSKKIGIEVTQIFKKANCDRPFQAIEEEARIIVEMALKHYEDKKPLPNLQVNVIFNSTLINKSERKSISNDLSSIVEKNLPEPSKWIILNRENFTLPDKISAIGIVRSKSLTKNYWVVDSSGYIQEDFINELQNTIDAKNSKLKCYLKECNSCWLLIVADDFKHSAFLRMSKNTENHIYSSNFERIYYIETFERKLISLKTAIRY
jgi:hypothetical protein